MNKPWRVWWIVVLTVFVITGMSVPANAWNANGDAPAAQDSSGDGYYFVQLKDEPVATYDGGIHGLQATRAEDGEDLSLKSSAVRAYGNYLREKRKEYKEWLNQTTSKAKVVAEYSLTLNGLAVKAGGVNPDLLRKGPGVKKVVKSISYRPAMNTSHTLINNQPLWDLGYDGEGIKVAVIDSGIDAEHPFLTDESLPVPEGFPKVPDGKEDWLKYTSNKVIVAKVFSPDPEATPEAIDSHGTHVAGTIAGIRGYKDPGGAAQSSLSGVAPKSYLGNYNVFPCENCSAESVYIAAAVEAAVRDGMDVANLSLGGPAEPGFDLLAEVVNAAMDAGMTVVISAGNSGPGPMTIGSPGTADKVITVAAVTNRHFFGTPIQVTVDGEQRTLPVGTASPGGQINSRVEAPLQAVTDGDGKACSGISADLTGKIAVIKRGDCTFTDKAEAAQRQGAVGVILVNNASGDPSAMSVEEKITIPMVMVTMEDGEWILKGSASSAVLEPSPVQEFLTDNHSLIANFSSRGPTVNYTLKPDVAAVGVNVYSSVVGGGLASYNGTSMSAPHVAGAAALLKQARPRWSPQDIKAALIATGKKPASANLPLEVGGGIIDVGKALRPVALARPASLSFGSVPDKGKKSTVTLEVALKNTSGKAQVYRFLPDSRERVDVSAASMRLAKGATGTITVTVTGKNKNRGEDYQGYIRIRTDNGQSIRIPYHFRVGK